MNKLENLVGMMNSLAEMVKIDNTTEDPAVESYNKGVEAMRNQVMFYIHNVLMGGEANG